MNKRGFVTDVTGYVTGLAVKKPLKNNNVTDVTDVTGTTRTYAYI